MLTIQLIIDLIYGHNGYDHNQYSIEYNACQYDTHYNNYLLSIIIIIN